MKTFRRTMITVAAVAGIGILAPSALAQQQSPPDNSAIDEYTESVPGATGNKPSSSLGDGSGEAGSGGGSLSPSTIAQLEALGADGAAAAALADAGSPGKGGGSGSVRDRGPGSEPGAAQGGSVSGIESVVSQVLGDDDSGGMGILLPLILLGSLVAVGAVAALTRRRGDQVSG